MQLEGKVQTAKMSDFFNGLELVVVDRAVIKPAGGRPQYSVRVVRGWPGLDELKELRKNNASAQDLATFAQGIPLPQEDQVIPLTVLDITGKQGFKTLICEVAQAGA
ncbi:hypothetical protein KSC_077010 [Ktedonobacter sp. SOSP1-52]|uniref:hypothetical protein n=1 Tax=Ktedonobacter sp. SOSP1-52 TaxID=2778366 RepID=UPI0019157037|nr:hypothetical protein [Ktedonobacter sp. SOSP1-52]GHO68809.1 hypothetical protein KSC_077010 [Ktedonobacter sp. SOSP1-52]